jgi:hypothetical protein
MQGDMDDVEYSASGDTYKFDNFNIEVEKMKASNLRFMGETKLNLPSSKNNRA